MQKINDVIYIDSPTTSCDGGHHGVGHPRVFLTCEKTGRIMCPYCSQVFSWVPHPELNQN